MIGRAHRNPVFAMILGGLLITCGTPQAPEAATTKPVQDTTVAQPHSGPQVVLLKDGGRMEGRMVNGAREGLWTAHHANGGLWSRSSYVNGLEEGPTEVFHPNGKPYYTGQYLHGLPIGEWVYHDSTGREVERVVHDSTGAVIKR